MKTSACPTPDVNLLPITESISTLVEGDQILSYTIAKALHLIRRDFPKTEWLCDTGSGSVCGPETACRRDRAKGTWHPASSLSSLLPRATRHTLTQGQTAASARTRIAQVAPQAIPNYFSSGVTCAEAQLQSWILSEIRLSPTVSWYKSHSLQVFRRRGKKKTHTHKTHNTLLLTSQIVFHLSLPSKAISVMDFS